MAIRLGELLRNEGLVSEEQLQEALEHQKGAGGRLGEILVSMGVLGEDDLASVLSKRLGVPSVDLDELEIDTSIVKIIPLEAARKYALIPLSSSGVTLRVAMADPTNVGAMDDIKFMTGYNIEPAVAPKTKIEAAISRHYSAVKPRALNAANVAPYSQGLTVDDLAGIGGLSEIDLDSMVDAEEETQSGKLEEDEIDLGALTASADVSPVVKLVNVMLVDAYKRGATDIHVEPYEKEFRVRFRIDGILYNVMALPMKLRDPLTSRIKSMFRADVAKRRHLQAGVIRITMRVQNRSRELDYSVATVPSAWGETIHLKLIDRHAVIPFSELGLEAASLGILWRVLAGARGMVLFTAPRRAGLSTTFYSALASLNTPDRQITTLEPFVEVALPGVNHVPMLDGKDLSAADTVRWIASRDTDIIGVSGFRDIATLDAALAAAHDTLVIAALRGSTAATRLVTLREAKGSELRPLALTRAVRAVVAQRLVRRVCQDCRTEEHATPEALIDMGFGPNEAPDLPLFKGEGCDACSGTGYRGRVGLFEVLEITDDIWDLLMSGADHREIERSALQAGMVTLRIAGIEKIKAGVTTVEEVFREVDVSSG